MTALKANNLVEVERIMDISSRLVVNKADFDDDKVALDEAYRLGLGEPLRVSAEHGRNFGRLCDEIDKVIAPLVSETETAKVVRGEIIFHTFADRLNIDAKRIIVAGESGE